MKRKQTWKAAIGSAVLLLALTACGAKAGGNAGNDAVQSALQETEIAGGDHASETGAAGTAAAAESSSGKESGTEETKADAKAETGEASDAAEKQQLPDFALHLLSGETVSVSDYRGKKLLLNFWATWCGPCVRELPAFERLSAELADSAAIIAINCSEDEKTVSSFMEKNGYTFPVALDTDGAVQGLFGNIPSIPATVIVDEEGYIVTAMIGASDADTMYAEYKELLSD